jgi:uncharacterized protein YbcV (DUF1398 family)
MQKFIMKKKDIEDAMRKRLDGGLSFEQFIDQAVKAGALYLSHVHHENACNFHSAETYFSFKLPYETQAAISPSLDIAALKKAIEALDEERITPEQFHEEKALAGVSVTHLFFKDNRVFYLGLNGEFYLEEW